MKNHLPALPSQLLRASLPILFSILVCGVLLHHLPPAHPSEAVAAERSQTMLAMQTTVTPGLEIILEKPALIPPAVDCKVDAWYPIPSGRDSTAYLTLNVDNPDDSTNSGSWQPNLPERGYYRIEAYIPLHDPIAWCTSGRIIPSDTAQAHYTVKHALGSSEVVINQVLPITATRWVSLGEFMLPVGSAARVTLTDLNGEANYSHTVSFSAMRFTFLSPAPEPVNLPIILRNWEGSSLPPAVVIAQGQGFDACGLPSLDKLKIWWNESPYQAFGLYMGGVHYPSTCTQVDSAWVASAGQQGWQFMPLWVGPQAPCTTYKYRLSYDPAVAYQQGRSEAALASTAAANLGLANSNLGGTLIYYDMEAYGSTNTTCITAVGAFLNGWTERLHELGNIAGVYSSACSPPPTYLAALPNPPDDFWGAYYYTSSYDPDASVFDMPCFSDSLWANHQRIYQYAGGHNEKWGGVEIAIDSNVIDGAVLDPTLASQRKLDEASATAPAAQQPPAGAAPVQDAGWLTGGQGWLIQSDRLYWSADGGQTWLDRTPDGAAVHLATFTSEKQGWTLSTLFGGGVRLYQTQDGGAHWKAQDLPVSADLWQPVQLQMEGEQGWVVLRRLTSAAFDIAVLLRTADGGRTWQTSGLPASGAITFLSQNEGWLKAGRIQGWYRTLDGGISWLPASGKNAPPQARPAALPVAREMAGEVVLSGTVDQRLAWAVTRLANCQGEKLSPGFACSQTDTLWLTRDGGITWSAIPQP